MTKIHLKRLLALICVCTLSQAMLAQVATPDFAYPKTVAEQAATEYTTAVNKGDQVAILSASIKSYLAEMSIDNDASNTAIKEFDNRTIIIKNQQIKALRDLFMATAYDQASNRVRYNYGRTLPLTPRPADINEWSKEMFEFVIDSLANEAYKNAGDMPLTDIKPLIKANDLTLKFFPTTKDFVASYILDVFPLNLKEGWADSIMSDMTKYHAPHSDAWYCWNTLAVCHKNENVPQQLQELYLSDPRESGRAYTLCELMSNVNISKLYKQPSEQVTFLEAAARDFKGYWIENIIKMRINVLMMPQLRLSSERSKFAAGETVKIPIKYQNLSTATINVYNFIDDITAEKSIKSNYSGIKPSQAITLDLGSATPNQRDTTIIVTLPIGCNIVCAKIEADEIKESSPLQLEAYDFKPIIKQVNGKTYLYVVNAADGTPAKDVEAFAISNYKDNKKTKLGKTDANGFLYFDVKKSSSLMLRHNGVSMQYDDVNLYHTKYSAPDNSQKITLTTNLGAYHLGDKMHYAGFLCDTLGVIKNAEIDITIYNTEYNNIGDTTLTTDEYGRFAGEFTLPGETCTGTFAIEAESEDASCRARFEVSDFKLPALKSDNLLTVGGIPADKSISITGHITNYAGFSLKGTKISAMVLGDEIDSTFTAVTDNDGKFKIVADSVFEQTIKERIAKVYGDKYIKDLPFTPEHFYPTTTYVSISALADDGTQLYIGQESISQFPNKLSLSSDDTVLEKTKPAEFDITLRSTEGDTITSSIKWRLYGNDNDSISVKEGETVPGKLILNINDLKVGKYTLRVAASDMSAQTVSTSFIAFAYNDNTLPVAKASLWTPDKKASYSDNTIKIKVLVDSLGANLIYGINSKPEDMQHTHLSSGWHTLSYQVDNLSKDDKLLIFNTRNYDTETFEYDIDTQRAPKKSVNLIIESFRDKVYTGDNEKWQLRLIDENNQGIAGAVIVNVYNTQLDLLRKPASLSSGPTYVWRPSPRFYVPYIGGQRRYYIGKTLKPLTYMTPGRPVWQTYNSNIELGHSPFTYDMFEVSNSCVDYDPIVLAYGKYPDIIKCSFSENIRVRGVGTVSGVKYKSNRLSQSTEEDYDEVEAIASDGAALEEVVTVGSNDSGSAEETAIEWREPEIFSALWQPNLVTDDNGVLDLSFIVPNALTTWRLLAYAWDKNAHLASISKTMTASKPIMVSVNMPRFVRRGDKATIIATAMNNSDESQNIKAIAEIFNIANDSVISSTTQAFTLAAGDKGTMSFCLDVNDNFAADSIGVRVRAANDTYGDGEQIALRVLDSESFVRECINFYLNPSDTTYTADIPSARGKDFKASLTFTANPMATVIEALPVLWDETWPTAASQSRALYGLTIALALEKEHPELSAIFDRKDLERRAKAALNQLEKLQRADGGWAWGEWSNSSSQWVTSSVLDRFYDLLRWGYVANNDKVNKMLTNAVKYYDSVVSGYDYTYTIVRSQYGSLAKPSLNGQKVIDQTLNRITRSWKKFDVDTKALSVIALVNNNRKATAKMIIGSLDQFATTSKTKGTEFKNERSLLAYGHLLEAYAASTPTSPIADGLRQHLIVRKQATDWGTSALTSYVVSSFINSGSKWTKPTIAPTLNVDNKPVDLGTPTGTASIYNVPVAGSSLTLNVGDAHVPSYGAIIATYTAPMSQITDYSEDDEVKISKRFIIDNGNGVWSDAPSTLNVGMKVRVSLTIKTTRPMSYVNISDQRAATFEPVEQLSRTMRQDGIYYYRENRDTCTNIFIDYLPQGTYVISYDVFVNNAGTFAGGVATITCDKAPTLTAHTGGAIITVVPAK